MSLTAMLTYPFMQRALIAGVLVSLCAALLGVPLVLKRYSMIGDGLSHVSFGALSVALAMGWSPLKVSIPVVVLAAFFLLRITENSKIKSDAAIALISASALAIGIIITSLTTGIYHKLFAVTFDESFAKATGVRVGVYNIVIAVLTAVTIVLGMRMMGAMLISSLVIFPCLTSMRAFKSFGGVVIASGIISMVCFLIGMTASYQLSTPAGASVVVVNLLVFLLFMAWQALERA